MGNDNVGINHTEIYYIIVIEGLFEDGSQISSFRSDTRISSRDIGVEEIKEKITNSVTEEAFNSHIKGLEELKDSDDKLILVKYFIQKIKAHTSRSGGEWTTFLEKTLILSRAVPTKPIQTDTNYHKKQVYYVYKHYYFDDNGNEVVFYIGKGKGDAKGGASRIYSHYRNKYWEEIVNELDKKRIKYFFEPLNFFESEREALTYELQLQKEYWDKGQCLGCADLRRRYGDPEHNN